MFWPADVRQTHDRGYCDDLANKMRVCFLRVPAADGTVDVGTMFGTCDVQVVLRCAYAVNDAAQIAFCDL